MGGLGGGWGCGLNNIHALLWKVVWWGWGVGGGVGLVTCMPRDLHSVSLDVLRLESVMCVMSVVLAQT